MNGVRCSLSVARISASTPLTSDNFGLAVNLGASAGTFSLRVIDQEGGELPHVFLGGTGDIVFGELGVEMVEGRPIDRLGNKRADIGHADFQNLFVIDVVRQAHAALWVGDHPGRRRDY